VPAPVPPAWQEEAIVSRLRELCPRPQPDAHARRGPARQQARRLREQALRQHVLELEAWAAPQGWTQPALAERLHVAARTLRQWQHGLRPGRPALLLGRPLLRSPRAERQAVLELLTALGPGLGLPTLQECFPGLPRCELEDLLGRYRRLWRRCHPQALHVLHWTRVGAVWALDFAEPPAAVDGHYPWLLAVRDLASGQQLLWLPLAAATAAAVARTLAGLFVVHGAPLVLKSDNGSAFAAEAVAALLAQAGVVPLFSPPYWPRYNGAIEAGIGSLKTRTEQAAARAGHPGQWSSDDVATAQAEANATARPHGPTGAPPEQAWQARQPLGAADRRLFQEAVAQARQAIDAQASSSKEGPPTVTAEREWGRRAVRRALEASGYLRYTRRRIPPTIPRSSAARIT